MDPKQFNGIYADIAAQTDCETAVRMFEILRGQMVVFPQKLFNPDYVRRFISEHGNEYTVRETAKMFGYSDRRIRQFIAEERYSKEDEK